MTKKNQLSLTIDEQIKNLQDLNLQFGDVEFAKNFLSDVSYFRFIKAYSLGLKSQNGEYNGVTFEQIVELYLFNANLRQQLFPHIERIEINLRTRIANYFSVKYSVLGYLDDENFPSVRYHTTFIENIRQLERNPSIIISIGSHQ